MPHTSVAPVLQSSQYDHRTCQTLTTYLQDIDDPDGNLPCATDLPDTKPPLNGHQKQWLSWPHLLWSVTVIQFGLGGFMVP
jgi:hypothetical protein